MWILLRKNFWMWRPPRSINVYIFALALAFSLLDWLSYFSSNAWVFPCFLTIILAQAGGASALDVDLKNDNVLFLECLPIRWWQVWTANWLDQLLACMLVVPLMCWHRVLTWTPPDLSDPAHHFRGDAEFAMFQSRWLLPAGLAAGTFFVYSYALLWRTFFKSHKAALLPTYFGSFLYIMLPLAMPAVLMVAPGLWDLWPLLVMQGFIFSICSLIVFAGPPRHWSRGRRFVIVGAPLLLIALFIELSAVWYTCKRCETLNWSEPELAYSVTPSTVSGRRWLVADVRSARSGAHSFILDPQSGESTYVGRNLRFGAADSRGLGEPLVAIPMQRPVAWLPMRRPVFSLTPDGSPGTTLFEDGFIRDELGNRFDVVDAQWVGSGTRLAVLAQSGRDRHRSLFIADKSGQTLRHLEVSRDYAQSFLTDGKSRILTTVPNDGPSHDAATDRVVYRLYDVAADTETKFELPGRALCFADDLTKVACLLTRAKDEIVHESIVTVDLTSRASRMLVEEGILAPIPSGEFAARDRYHDLLPHQTRLNERAQSDEPLIVFDHAFQRAVLVVDRYEGAAVFMSLVCVEAASGHCHTIVSEAQLGSRGVSSPHQGFDLLGLTPDGSACLYRSNTMLVHVTVADGRAQVTQVPDDSGRVDVSPNGRRALIYTFDHKSENPSGCWQVLDLPTVSRRCTIADAVSLQWLGDDQLIVTRASGVSLVNVDGKNERQLLPPPTDNVKR